MRVVRLYDTSLIALTVLLVVGLLATQSRRQKQQEVAVEEFNEIMESWNGRSETSLYVQWGPPTEIYDDGSGGKIVVYRELRQQQRLGYSDTRVSTYTGHITTTSLPPRIQEWTVWRAFWVDRTGTIYHWAWQGL